MSEEISAVQNGDSIDISEAERELIPSKGYIVDHITGEHVVTLLVGVRPPILHRNTLHSPFTSSIG